MTKILVCDGMDKTVFENLQKVDGFDVFPSPKNDQGTILKEAATAEGIRRTRSGPQASTCSRQ